MGFALHALGDDRRALRISQDCALPVLFPLCASYVARAYTLAGRLVEAVALAGQAAERAAARRPLFMRAREVGWLAEKAEGEGVS